VNGRGDAPFRHLVDREPRRREEHVGHRRADLDLPFNTLTGLGVIHDEWLACRLNR
jgi:hypothetical protein